MFSCAFAVAVLRGGSNRALAFPKAWFSPQKSVRAKWAKQLYYGYRNTTNAVIQKCYDVVKNLQFNRSKNGPYLVEPLLRQLHWLPVHSRIRFKLVTNSPQYIASHIRFHQSVRSLRSSDQHFIVPTPSSTNIGSRSFPWAAPVTATGSYNWALFVSALLYSDDILLLAPSTSSLQKLLSTCEHQLGLFDLAININKSVATSF